MQKKWHPVGSLCFYWMCMCVSLTCKSNGTPEAYTYIFQFVRHNVRFEGKIYHFYVEWWNNEKLINFFHHPFFVEVRIYTKIICCWLAGYLPLGAHLFLQSYLKQR